MGGGNNEPGDSLIGSTASQPAHGHAWPARGPVPIQEHGVIGDLRTVALVGSDGTIDWLCFPHFDSPSVFAALLDPERGGHFRITPEPNDVVRKQFYWPDTNVLVTRFLHPDGILEVIDFMPVPIRGDACEHQIIRKVNVVLGRLPVRVECRPAFDYARAAHTTRPDDCGVRFDGPDLCLVLTSPIPLQIDGGGVVAEITLGAGEERTFVLQVVPPAHGTELEIACGAPQVSSSQRGPRRSLDGLQARVLACRGQSSGQIHELEQLGVQLGLHGSPRRELVSPKTEIDHDAIALVASGKISNLEHQRDAEQADAEPRKAAQLGPKPGGSARIDLHLLQELDAHGGGKVAPAGTLSEMNSAYLAERAHERLPAADQVAALEISLQLEAARDIAEAKVPQSQDEQDRGQAQAATKRLDPGAAEVCEEEEGRRPGPEDRDVGSPSVADLVAEDGHELR